MTDILERINKDMNSRPSEVTAWRSTMHDARAEIERLQASSHRFSEPLVSAHEAYMRLREALEACDSWIDRWTKHVGSCEGGDKCTCGRSAVLYEAQKALNPEQTVDGEKR